MTAATDIPEDDDALAAEYALHVLGPSERRAAERRIAAEPALAAAVRSWNERFSVLADDIAEEPLPPRVKAALDRRLFGQPSRRFAPGRILAGVFAAAALGVAVLVLLPTADGPPATLSAEIAAEDRSLVIEARLAGDTLQITRRAGGPPPGRVLELWLIAPDAPAPVSLGVLPDTETAAFTVDAGTQAVLAGATLAISEEPPGGSPTGAPTGAVLAAGTVASL